MNKCKLSVLCCMTLLFLINAQYGLAAQVVVVPLGGGGTGNAEKGDVLKGKTFSNSTKKGVVGTRPAAPVAKTGQTYTIGAAGSGEDGDLQKGGGWPSPRFDTATSFIGYGGVDFLTGLVWQDNLSTTQKNFSEALTYCNDLETGLVIFGYSDWRLPNVKELQSLVDFNNKSPALPTGHGFTGVQASGQYWTSTTWTPGDEFEAFTVNFTGGSTEHAFKGLLRYVWCVRGPY
jgi:hypothetical protein